MNRIKYCTVRTVYPNPETWEIKLAPLIMKEHEVSLADHPEGVLAYAISAKILPITGFFQTPFDIDTRKPYVAILCLQVINLSSSIPLAEFTIHMEDYYQYRYKKRVQFQKEDNKISIIHTW